MRMCNAQPITFLFRLVTTSFYHAVSRWLANHGIWICNIFLRGRMYHYVQKRVPCLTI